MINIYFRIKMTAKVIRRTLEEATNVGKNHLLFINKKIIIHKIQLAHFLPLLQIYQSGHFQQRIVYLKESFII